MKKLIVIVLILIAKIGSSQKVMTIKFCDEMTKQKENSLIQLSIVKGKDTLIIPKIGKDKYLSPIEFYKLNIQYKSDNTSQCILLIENNDFIYKIGVYIRDLFCNELEVCVKKNMR